MSDGPWWPAHFDDGVWYCDAHNTFGCPLCAAAGVRHELNQQMLTYLMAMSREEQERIPPTRAGFIAWLGTEAGLEWLLASPIRDEIVVRDLLEYVSDKVGYQHERGSREDAMDERAASRADTGRPA